MVADEIINRSSGRFFRILSCVKNVQQKDKRMQEWAENALFEDSEQKVGIRASFVRFVHHDYAVATQKRVHHGLSKQHAVGEIFNTRSGRRRQILEANRVPDLSAR
jgi:hypothetical protein